MREVALVDVVKQRLCYRGMKKSIIKTITSTSLDLSIYEHDACTALNGEFSLCLWL